MSYRHGRRGRPSRFGKRCTPPISRALQTGRSQTVSVDAQPTPAARTSRGPARALPFFGVILDKILPLLALLGGEGRPDGLELLLPQGLALFSLRLELVGEGSVDAADFVPLVGRQVQLVGNSLKPLCN